MSRSIARAAAAALCLAAAAVPLTTLPAPAQAETSSARPAPRITLKVDDATPTVGDRIKLKGVARHVGAGTRISLQVKYDNRKAWKTEDTARVGASGRFRLHEKVTSGRTRLYRVVRPAAVDTPRAVSNRVKVVSYEWKTLISFGLLNGSGVATGTSTIDGVDYPDSLVATTRSTSGAADLNVLRACTRLRLTAGLSDQSATGTSGTATLALDGTPAYTGTFALTQGQAVDLDLTRVFRVTVSYGEDVGAQVVFGSPQALCHD